MPHNLSDINTWMPESACCIPGCCIYAVRVWLPIRLSSWVKSLYGEEGQAGGGRMVCPEGKPIETFIMHIFIGTCVTQTNLSPCQDVNLPSCSFPVLRPHWLTGIGLQSLPLLTYTILSTEQGCPCYSKKHSLWHGSLQWFLHTGSLWEA